MKTTRELQTKIFDKINPTVRFSVSRYVLAIGLFVAVFIFGVMAVMNLGVDQFPSSNFPIAFVSTTYAGASPNVMDKQVTQVIESAVSTMSGITSITSTSSSGSSQVLINFDQSTDQNSDANQVASLVSAARGQLPSSASSPTIQTMNPNTRPILQFGVAGPGVSLEEVSSYVTNNLIPVLQRVSGVANVSVSGGPSREFHVLLNPDRLKAYGLSPDRVVSAISTSAITKPIGTIDTHSTSFTFSTENVPSSKQSVEKIVINSGTGARVSDIGNVRDVSVSTTYARINGKPVVLVAVQQTTNSNAVAVVKNVRGILARTQLPAGYELIYSNDTTSSIQASINSTYRELFVTALVVALLVLLFLGKLDTAFSVILAIPVALSAAPILYRLCGFTFNLVSMLALIVAIGIVVDDSIVVAENVERYRAMGYGAKESVLKGASEIFSAVVAATLSILAVLVPVSFMGGMMGSFLRQFCLGLAAAVFWSLLEALLFLTVRLAYLKEKRDTTHDWADVGRSLRMMGKSMRWGLTAWRKPGGIVVAVVIAAGLLVMRSFLFLPGLLVYPVVLGILRYVGLVFLSFFEALTATLHGWTEAALEWVREGYAKSLVGVLKHSGVILLSTLAVVVVALALLLPKLTFTFMPQTDNGTLSVYVSMHKGAVIDSTNRMAGTLEKYLTKQPEVEVAQATVGGSGMFGGTSSPENISIQVRLVDVGKRAGTFDLIAKYREEMNALVLQQDPSAMLTVSAGGGFGGGGSTLSLNLFAADKDLLTRQNGKILQAIRANANVMDVTSSLSDITMERDFLPNETQMKGTGITATDVASLLQTYASGTTAANVEIGGLSYPVDVQIDPKYLTDAQSLMNLPIYSSVLQTYLQVGQLGSIVVKQSPVSITRANRLYSATLSINLKKDAPAALAFQNQLTADLTQQGLLGNGITLGSASTMGQGALASQLSTTGPLAFLLAFFLAYLVMAAQFNSWRYPIYLLLPVPLAIIGALLFAILLGGSLDIFGLLGMLLLIGLSAKNAILYLDFVVERISTMALKDALIDSARLRFRPIIMTTLTVLVISGPLVFGTGQGSEFGHRLGVVMFGGIISSAILTFFVVPAAFYLFERKRVQKAGEEAAVGTETAVV